MKRRNFFTSLLGASAATTAVSLAKPQKPVSRQIPFHIKQNDLDEQGKARIRIEWPETLLEVGGDHPCFVPKWEHRWENLEPGEFFFYGRLAINHARSQAPTGYIEFASQSDVLPQHPSAAMAAWQSAPGWFPLPVMTIRTPLPNVYPINISMDALDSKSIVAWAKQHPDVVSQIVLLGLSSGSSGAVLSESALKQL